MNKIILSGRKLVGARREGAILFYFIFIYFIFFFVFLEIHSVTKCVRCI